MILGILPEQGGSLANLRRSGQDERFIRAYLARYARCFERVYYFSYANETADLPPNCQVVPNPGYHRWAYAFLLPFVQRRLLRTCAVLRVMQAYGAIPAMLSKLLYGIPYAATYGYRYDVNARLQGQPWRAVGFALRAGLAARLADRVIVTTPAMADYVRSQAPRARLLHIPNGVDTAQFVPGAAAGGAETVITVGRLSVEKNLALLLEAAALLRRPALRLVLVGDGPERQNLAAQAQRLGLAVSFLGVRPHAELPGLLQQAAIFALPSRSEGHPKALLEAMSCGLACLGTDVPGIREVIHDEQTGLLAPLSPAGLAKGLGRLLDDATLRQRLGAAARQYVCEHYEQSRLLELEIQALQVLGRARSRP